MAAEDGTPVSEEMVLPLLADYLLPRGPGKLVITNISSTAQLEEIAARHGGRVVRVPVGRQAAIDALSTYRPEQIALAGEGTGAVMMPQFRFVYDGIASMLAVLSMLHESGRTLSRVLGAYPKYSILKGQVPLVTQRIPALLMDLRERYADGRVNVLDGLRVDWPDRWFHVRVSQTEPIVRVICEQRGDPPKDLFEALLEQGARSVSACATHAVLSGPAVERIEASPLQEVVFTNSIPLSDEARRSSKIKSLSVAPLLARAIQSIHDAGRGKLSRGRSLAAPQAIVKLCA